MELKQLIQQIDTIKSELDSLRPISSENMSRFTQKIRLEWNYHSNNIEGNRLTYGETKALILFGTTAQAKPLKDHLEVKGHDEAVKYLEDIIKQERPLTETFICELHEMVLKEPYEVDAITPGGKPIKRTISIGEYKKVPNHVKTKTGEIFRFASPEETPAEMGALMQWYKTEKQRQKIHPVILAIEFHYRFIRIHPFDDGNGRIARLLMNFIFMQHGFTPAIIKTEDKQNYYVALQQADSGDLDFFFTYVAKQLIDSLELLLKAAKGERIEEPDDLDKKLQLLQKEIEAEDEENEIKTKLTIKSIKDSFDNWGYILLQKLADTTVKFNRFYDSPNHDISVQFPGTNAPTPDMRFKDKISFDSLKKFWNQLDSTQEPNNANLRFSCHFGGFKKGGLNTFGCNYTFEVKFETYKYEVFVGYYSADAKGQKTKSYTQKLLHKSLTDNEIEEIVTIWGNTLLEHITRNKADLNNSKN